MTGVGNLGEKIAIKIINDFLNFERSMCDATTQSLSRYCTYPVPVVKGEILCEEAQWHPDKGKNDKNCKLLKSKMANGRHFENR